MSTSGTVTFNQTRDQIISDSLSLLGVLSAGETANTNDISLCSNLLNKMVKAWMGQGIHLWTEESGTVFFVQNQAQYNILAGASGAKASDGTGTPVETTLSSAASNGASSISVTTATGMSSGDVIGVVQDNQTILWTTINGAPSGTTVTLLSPLTNAASSGNSVFTYTSQMPRALSIQSARLRNKSGFDRYIKMITRDEYMNIPEKTSSGSPVIVMYSPQLSRGEIYVWPVPSDVNERLEVSWLREIQDFDSGTDNPDLPQEWLEALTYNLAVRAAPAYGINLSSGGIQGNPDILRQAAQYLEEMKAWDAEQPYVKIIPNFRNSK